MILHFLMFFINAIFFPCGVMDNKNVEVRVEVRLVLCSMCDLH